MFPGTIFLVLYQFSPKISIPTKRLYSLCLWRHPEVMLTLLLPYHPYDRPTPTPPGFDSTFYPPGMETVPKRAAIIQANRYMVEHSDYLIAYVRHSVSNAWDLEVGDYPEPRGVR